MTEIKKINICYYQQQLHKVSCLVQQTALNNQNLYENIRKLIFKTKIKSQQILEKLQTYINTN